VACKNTLTIVFLFYEGMTALDAIGPHEVFTRLPNASTKRVALQAGPISTCSGLMLTAEHSLAELSEADLLVIPGGGKATSLSQFPEILEWVQMIHKTTTWTTSVCTGSLILGAAGLLQGLPATTHWSVMERLERWGAIPTTNRVVEAGKIITAAGVSAGIDMALLLAAKIAGQMVAESLQLAIEYDPVPPFNAGSPTKADPKIVGMLRERLMNVFETE
jgi:transcriptional regulator GlxA family with amidase domain